MNKVLLGIALLSASFLGFTAFGSKHGHEIGNYVPELNLFNATDSTEISVNDLQGKYTLLNFWSSDDASSRLKEKIYQTNNLSDLSDSMHYVSVNLDRNTKLGLAVSRIDGFDPLTQYYIKGSMADIIKKYGMKENLKSFLLDSNGEIVSINPTVAEIQSFLN